MSGQHTPGPWFVEDPFDFELSIVEAGKPTHEWRFIASCGLPEGEDDRFTKREVHANARLIAAAPELFDALKAAREALADAVIEASGGMFDAATVGEHLVIAQIDAALTLAGDKE